MFPPCGEMNFSRMVWRGMRSRSPGSVSSNPISTKFMGSTWGDRGVAWKVVGVARDGPTIDVPDGGTGSLEGVDGVLEMRGIFAVAGVGVVVIGVAGLGGEIVAGLAGGIEGGGMRVMGVAIGARIGFGRGTEFRFPDGGGIRVTGVANSLGGIGGGTGARGILLGTGGIGAD